MTWKARLDHVIVHLAYPTMLPVLADFPVNFDAPFPLWIGTIQMTGKRLREQNCES
jgi:hypothetical protein